MYHFVHIETAIIFLYGIKYIVNEKECANSTVKTESLKKIQIKFGL